MTWRELIQIIETEGKQDEPVILEADFGELLPVEFDGQFLQVPL